MHTLWYFNIAMKNHTCSQVNHVLVILNRPCSVAMLNYHELPIDMFIHSGNTWSRSSQDETLCLNASISPKALVNRT